MKKKFLLFSIIAVLIITLVGCGVNMIFKIGTSKNEDRVGTFNLDDYSNMIDWYVENKYFPKENVPESLGFIDSPQVAKEKGVAVLKEIYGEESLKDEEPFTVAFDEKNQAWLIQGTLPDNMEGGVAHIIIQKSDGKVVAIWHDK